MAYRILVVDDDESIRELLTSCLEGEGYEVILASNGQEGVRLAESADPHLMIIDVRMPELDGIQACSRVRSNGKIGSTPIIIATAFRDGVVEALDAGADDFVMKPFFLAELLIRVKTLLKVRHLKDEFERAWAYMQELRENLPPLGLVGIEELEMWKTESVH